METNLHYNANILALWIHNENKPTMDPPSNSNILMSVNAMASYAGNMWKDIESKNKEKTLPPETNQEQVQRPNNVKTYSSNTILNKVTRYIKPKYITMHRVGTRNMVPKWMTKVNQAYAKAFKPKITFNLSTFPPVIGHQFEYKGEVDEKKWKAKPVKTFTPGTSNKLKNPKEFVKKRIDMCGSQRNDPNIAAVPKMIPWENMGQVAMKRAALNVKKLQYTTPKRVVEKKKR